MSSCSINWSSINWSFTWCIYQPNVSIIFRVCLQSAWDAPAIAPGRLMVLFILHTIARVMDSSSTRAGGRKEGDASNAHAKRSAGYVRRVDIPYIVVQTCSFTHVSTYRGNACRETARICRSRILITRKASGLERCLHKYVWTDTRCLIKKRKKIWFNIISS